MAAGDFEVKLGFKDEATEAFKKSVKDQQAAMKAFMDTAQEHQVMAKRIAEVKARATAKEQERTKKLADAQKAAATAEMKENVRLHEWSKRAAEWDKQKSKDRIDNAKKYLRVATMVSAAVAAGLVAVGRQALLVGDEFKKLSAQMKFSFGAQGAEITEMIEGMSQNLNVDKNTLAGWAQKLREAGLEGEQLRKTMLAMADVQSVGFNPEAFTSAAQQIKEKMESMGPNAKVTGAEIVKMWEQTGMSRDRILKTLGIDATKMTAQQINQALMKPFGAAEGLEAMLRGVQDQTGQTLGTLAMNTQGVDSETLSGSWNKLSQTFQDLLKDVDMTPFTGAIADLMGWLKKKEVVDGFKIAFGALGDTFRLVINIATTLVEAILRIPEFLANIPTYLSNLWTEINAELSQTWENFRVRTGGWGPAIVQGIWTGLKTAFMTMLKVQFPALFLQLPASVKKVLGIASPSKVMRDQVGVHIPTGIVEGVKESAPVLQKVIENLITVPQMVASNSGPSMTWSGNVNINASGAGSGGGVDPGAIHDAVLSALRTATMELAA